MEPIKIKLDGKIYEIDWSKFTIEQYKKLLELIEQFRKNEDFNTAYEALELITGIEKRKLNELDGRIINKILAIIKKEGEKKDRLNSH